MKKTSKRIKFSSYLKIWLLSFMLCPSFVSTFSQNTGITVTGTISDDIGPISGVTILVKGSSTGTTSNLNGEFTIKVPSEESILEFRFLGYETQEVVVGKRRILPITLSESTNVIDEVTIVAFGKQKKESVIGSISTINPSELKVPSSNLTSGFAGRLSGMVSYQRSGEPGADNAQFFIRGVTTFGYKKDPLILIDNNESTTQELARMQPDDIASFSIMKDATATALYGSRGANGVILVTTKSGFDGKAKISVRFEEALSQPTKMVELADPITYMRLNNEAVRTRDPLGITPYSQNKIDNTVARGNPYVYPANDWYDILFKDYTNNHRLNFSVAGGGKIVRYYVAGSILNDNGVLKVDKQNNFNNNVSLNRYMLRSNINIDISKTTEMVARMSSSFDDYSGPMGSGSDIFRGVMKSNPVLFPAYYAPDKANQYTQHILFGNYGNGFIRDNKFLPSYNNPYAEMTKGYKESQTTQMAVQFEIKQKLDFITEGLSLRGLFNTNRYSYYDVSRFYEPFYYQVSSYNRKEDEYTLMPINERYGTEYLDYREGEKKVNSTTYFEATANWIRTFEKVHELSGLLVYTMRNEIKGNAGNLQKSLAYRNISFAGRATYAYDSRYLSEFNFGYNGSERFSKNERFGFFPSAGLGWIISNEAFWNEGLKETINNLKIKGTYGLVGNDAIGTEDDRFFYLSNVNMNDDRRKAAFGTYGNYGDVINGVSISRYANDQITWETAEKMNLTLEVGLWNKLDVQLELFNENRSNILMTRPGISTMGLQADVRANVGEAAAKGVDLSINLNHSFNKDLWISGMANFTYAKSKFKLYEEPDYSATPWKSHEGYSLKQEWGYIAERLFVDEEEVRNSPTQFGNYMAGDIKYKDLNHDGKITELDMAPIGYPTDPEIIYGFGASAGWKGFDFSFFFQGLAHESFTISTHEDWDNGVVNTTPFLNGQNALLKAYADSHWSEDNRDLYAVWPRLSTTESENNTKPSNWWIRDGSFIRLKSVEFGYSLPERIISKAKLTNLRFYFSGTNLLTFSQFKLWDPEMGGNGMGYPVQRVFNLGLQLSF